MAKEAIYYPTIGKEAFHHRSNENGKRLIHLAESRKMVIGTTLFQHKDVNKTTWRSPDVHHFSHFPRTAVFTCCLVEGCDPHRPNRTLRKFVIHYHATLIFFPQALQFQNKMLITSKWHTQLSRFCIHGTQKIIFLCRINKIRTACPKNG